MKWFKHKKIDKIKNAKKVLSLKVDLGQFNLVDKQYSQKSEVLYTLKPNKSYGYLLNVEVENLGFLKPYNIGFDHFIIMFTDKNRGSF